MIEVDEETLPYAEEDWQEPEQIELPKNLEPDLPFTIQTRQSDRSRLTRKYNPYGDDFACLGMAERNDVGPKGYRCHDSKCRP